MAALRQDIPDDGEWETLEQVVARIQARGEIDIPRPPQDVIDRLAARVAAEPSMSREEMEEWNRQWDGAMDEIKRSNRENSIAEGRG